MSDLARLVCSIIACSLCVIVLALTIAAIPTDALKNRTDEGMCYSMWGLKTCGSGRADTALEFNGFPCKDVHKKMTSAAAVSIAGCATAFISLVFHVLQLFKIWSPASGVCGIVVAFCTFVLVLVGWVQIVSSRDRKCTLADGSTYALKKDYKLSLAFPLLLTAWIVQTVNFVFIGCGW